MMNKYLRINLMPKYIEYAVYLTTGGKKVAPVPISKLTQNTNKMNEVINIAIILDKNT